MVGVEQGSALPSRLVVVAEGALPLEGRGFDERVVEERGGRDVLEGLEGAAKCRFFGN